MLGEIPPRNEHFIIFKISLFKKQNIYEQNHLLFLIFYCYLIE